MRSKKIRLILVISIITVLVIICALLAFVLLAGDALKSNKEKFVKYAFDMIKDDQTTIDLNNYFAKQLTTPFESSGKYYTNISDESNKILTDKEQKAINDTVINFEGKIDLKNKISRENISINYNENVNVPLNFIMTEDVLGVQSDYIGKRYISVENNIVELINQLTSNQTDLQEEEVKQKFDELKDYIGKNYNLYIKAVMDAVDDSKFTSAEENGEKIYIATLNMDDLKNMYIAILETLKNDQEMIDKINELIQSTNASSTILTPQIIDEGIKNIQDNQDSQNNFYNVDSEETENSESDEIEIKVYTNKKETIEISMESNAQKISFKKNLGNDNVEYEFLFSGGENYSNGEISFKANYRGLAGNNVEETYEIELKVNNDPDKLRAVYTLNRNVAFVDELNIDMPTDDEITRVDKMETGQRENFTNAITERIVQVNEMNMKELGLEDSENLLINEIPIVGILLNTSMGIYRAAEETADDDGKSMTHLALESRLQLLSTQYQVEGSKINDLIQEVRDFNQEFENSKISIKANVSNWDYDNNQADTNSYYKVDYEKDDNERFVTIINIKDAD